MTRFIFNVLKLLLSQSSVASQQYFLRLYEYGLKGMGFGIGSKTSLSGEEILVKKISSDIKLQKEKDLVIFDVGGNKGDYTSLILKNFHDFLDFRIFVFEPQYALFNQLVEKFSLDKNVKILPEALSEKSGNSKIYGSQKNDKLASLHNRRLDHFDIEFSEFDTISLITIDEFLEKNELSKIDFLKLDVEGHELSVLKGAKQALRERRIKRIQFEFGGCNIDSRTFFQDFWYLLSPDFEIYRILQDGMVKLNNYSESYEIFKTVNYYAELRS